MNNSNKNIHNANWVSVSSCTRWVVRKAINVTKLATLLHVFHIYIYLYTYIYQCVYVYIFIYIMSELRLQNENDFQMQSCNC